MSTLFNLTLIVIGLFLVGGACAAPSPEPSPATHDASSPGKKRVIILCTGNSCRSQMAEAFWRTYGGDHWDVVSAGTKPSGKVYPGAIQVMAEKGIDISKQQSKSLEPYKDQRFDLVITVCADAERSCPTFAGGKKHIHHGFDDPPKAPGTDDDRLRVCRRVRDEIEVKVKEWIAAEGS